MNGFGSAALIERLEGRMGLEIGPSRWILVDQDRIDRFAAATSDEQWIHVDPERAAAESPFGGTVAHGMLTLSLVPRLAIELLELEEAPLVINYGLNRVRFPAPLGAGGRVRMYLTVTQLERAAGGARLTFDARVDTEEGSKPVCVAQLIFQVQ